MKLLTKIYNLFLISAIIVSLTGIPSIAAERVIFYHTDPVGTPLAMTDENGDVVWETDYLPFGEEDVLPEDVTDVNTNKFVGKEKDEETDLYYFGARYLDDRVGRFIKTDPVGISESDLMNPQRFNRYAYGLNNPYKYVDPDGRIVVPVGSPQQIKEINKVLSTIANSNPQNNKQLQELRDSDNTHTIRFPKPGERTVNRTTGKRINERNDIGTGSETIVDVTKSINIDNRITLSPESVTVHELLGHGLDKDRGKINRSINPNTGQKISEESAMKRANTYRQSVKPVKEKLRKKY